ncbi:hypothetical protein CGRA01v4_02323 [Colletotrichum graminicola]|nr:hypothetical protein CGRA01v4_02323 [Colletotrichum graminicola]
MRKCLGQETFGASSGKTALTPDSPCEAPVATRDQVWHYLPRPRLTMLQLCRDPDATSRAASPPRLQLPRNTRKVKTCRSLAEFGSIDECHETTLRGRMQILGALSGPRRAAKTGISQM